MANPNQNPATGEQSDELRNLRSTVPRMMEPMSVPSSSAEAVFSTVRESTKAAYSEVREYKYLATDEQSTKIFERAKHSRKENPKGIKPWRARDDPDWLTPDT
ncbi:hypothetical protein SLS53_006460 [Cytospora paraplurivora]|uniref:Uncharacterized protein n=1 Tax=Cytospora paraplurivora TaxID=2898453 RepID=A0AAN9U3T3_9PEZI